MIFRSVLIRALFLALALGVCPTSGFVDNFRPTGPISSGESPVQRVEPRPDASDRWCEDLEATALTLINRFRKDHRLGPLLVVDDLQILSRVHSRRLADTNLEAGHDGFAERLERARQSLSVLAGAENIAFNQGFSDPAETAVNQWITSPEHRKNLLGPYDRTGIGVVRGQNDAFYFTQILIQTQARPVR